MATRTPVRSGPAPAVGLEARKTQAVKIWATVGVFWFAVTAYAWGNWIASGHVKPSPIGPTDVPTWHLIAARSWEVIMVVGGLAAVYFFLVRPWRRERRLTFDGMFLLGWLATWAIQDPLVSYTRQWFNYSSVFLDFGCPQCHIPGWQAPNGARMAEPFLFDFGAYSLFLVGGCILCNLVMRRAKQRWPQLGTFGLVMVAFGTMVAADVVMELVWLRFGLYTYAGSISWLTLFHGHYYQYPIYEGIFWGANWAAMSCLRYFRNDKGQSVAERGVDELSVSPKRRTGLRLLALCGIMNTIYFGFYNVPVQWFGTHADNFPQDVLDRSYLTNGMCGLGTDQACPGPRVPMPPGPDAAHATPDGRMVAPEGLPVQIRP